MFMMLCLTKDILLLSLLRRGRVMADFGFIWQDEYCVHVQLSDGRKAGFPRLVSDAFFDAVEWAADRVDGDIQIR